MNNDDNEWLESFNEPRDRGISYFKKYYSYEELDKTVDEYNILAVLCHQYPFLKNDQKLLNEVTEFCNGSYRNKGPVVREFIHNKLKNYSVQTNKEDNKKTSIVRYLASIVIFLGGIIYLVTISGNSLLAFVDAPSLSLVVIFPFLFIGTFYGFKEMGSAFSAPFKKGNTLGNLTKASIFFQRYEKITWLAGLLGVIIGMIGILRNLDDKASMGPNIALVLESVFYSSFINISIIIPYLILIKKCTCKTSSVEHVI